MQKLTRAGVAMASTGLTLLGLGMVMGNLELLVLASAPLLMLAASFATRAEADATGARTLSTRAPRRGDTVDVEVRVTPPAAAHVVEVHQPVPAGFSLDGGSNVALLTGSGAGAMRFRMRAHSRGAHTLAAPTAEIVDPHGLLAPRRVDLGPPERLEVAPRSLGGERLRRRGAARLVIDRQETRAGTDSTDFRELRDYLWGDSPKAINWKATARRLSAMGRGTGRSPVPLVNEYEKEGRTTVLILLDAGRDMRVGTSLETGLDHAVEACLAAARLMLSRGARVGAATFGAKSALPAAPDVGSGQIPGIERALSPGDIDPDITPAQVLGSLQRHLAGSRPMLIVVTRVTARNAEDLIEVARRMRVLVRERRRALPMLVVDVRALALAPAPSPAWETARSIVEAEDSAAAREVAAAGARVVPWDPSTQDLRTALLRRELA